MSVETEIALLKREVDDMKQIHVRLDSAIEKIAEVSSSLHTVIAVHESKLARQEETLDENEKHFREIMHVLGMDLSDDSLKGTPHRVAKMYVKEIFSGLNPSGKPTTKLFDNKYNYDQMLVEKDITFYSHCEHHFVPIFGKAHVAYFSSGKDIGLSLIHI